MITIKITAWILIQPKLLSQLHLLDSLSYFFFNHPFVLSTVQIFDVHDSSSNSCSMNYFCHYFWIIASFLGTKSLELAFAFSLPSFVKFNWSTDLINTCFGHYIRENFL